MTSNDLETNLLESEDLSLEFVSAGPLNLPRLESAQLIVEFSRISQNAYRLHRTLENYWKMKVEGVRFPAGSQGKEDFDAIEAIVYRQAPSETRGKQYLTISLDTEAEKRIISVAVGMSVSGVSLRQIQTAFLPKKQISQILDIAKSLEEIQDGEVVLFKNTERPESSALVNLTAITKSPGANSDSLAKTLAEYWRIRRSGNLNWTNLGPIFFDDIANVLRTILEIHLTAQYWSTENGSSEIKIKVENYVKQLLNSLQNQNNLINILRPSNSEIIWTCGWKAAADHSGINLPDPSDDDLNLLEDWILGQFGSKAAGYIRANRESTIAPAIKQFESFVKRVHLLDDDNPKDFGLVEPKVVEINPFADSAPPRQTR